MNNRDNFEVWLSHKFGEKNGTKSSYLKALKMISEKFHQNVFVMNNPQQINNLYQDLKKEQRNVNGKYFNIEAPSYGAKGFYSAAVKNYLIFITNKDQ